MEAEEKKRPTEALPQLSVTNFGPIEEAQLDLRPLTVFIGPSNTGKSYLAILIYALHRYFGGRAGMSSWRFHRLIQSLLIQGSSEATSGAIKELAELLSAKVIKHEADKSGSPEYIDVPESVTTFLATIFREAGEGELGEEVARCFGVEAAALCRKNGSGTAQITIRVSPDGTSESIEHQLVLGAEKAMFDPEIPEKISLKLQGDQFDIIAYGLRLWNESEDTQVYRSHFLRYVALLLHRNIYKPFGRSAYYLPADRTGIMHAHKAVVGAVLGSAAMTGIRRSRNMPLLSGIVGDFLETLITLDEPIRDRRDDSRGHESILDICIAIEKSIMGGSVSTERSEAIEYPEFVYQPTGWKESLPLKNASSMVSELSPVVLYLRHQVEPGDVLIIEEPESHLHPAMQVQFTRQLAAIVNAGVRVIVTTHSEWVLEELANLVRLSSVKESDRARIDDDDVSLDPAQVGAWLFKAGEPSKGEGSSVAEIAIDDSGVYPAGFDDVAAELHNEWAEITRQREN